MPDGFIDFDSKFQTEMVFFDSMNRKSDEVLDSIEEAYNEDGANKLSEEELQQAVLNGTVPTSIVNFGASASCDQPSLSDCRRSR